MRKSLETCYNFFKPQTCITRLKQHFIRRMAHYHVDNSNYMSTDYVHSTNNPLLMKLWSKKPETFQHPSIGRMTCDQPGCTGKICIGLCGLIIKREYVGHATHQDYPGSVFLSYTDFNGAKRPQYFVFYKSPVYNYDVEGKNINIQKTMVLHADHGMLIIIHVNSSTKPTIYEITD